MAYCQGAQCVSRGTASGVRVCGPPNNDLQQTGGSSTEGKLVRAGSLAEAAHR